MKRKITGGMLADSLNKIITQKKLDTLTDKLLDYYLFISENSVDIPEFCKMKDDRIASKINRDINFALKTNSLDFFYNRLTNQ